LQVGVALEVASLLASGRWTLPRAVIFLFNGAEEFNWLGAHGFITSDAPLQSETPGTLYFGKKLAKKYKY